MRIAEYLKTENTPVRGELGKLMAAYPPEAPLFPLRLSAGESLLHEEDPCRLIYLLLAGRVSVVTNQPRVSRYTLSEFGAIEFFGEYEALGGLSRYIAEVRAVTDCRLLALPTEEYLLWMRRDPDLFFVRVRHILEHLLYQTANERNLHFLDAAGQAIQFLIRAYEKGGGPPGTVRIGATRTEMAETMGNSVRTVNRAVHSLSDRGLVTVKNGKLQLSAAQYASLKQEFDSLLK